MTTEDQTGRDIASLAEQAARGLLEAAPPLKAARPIERVRAIAEVLRGEQIFRVEQRRVAKLAVSKLVAVFSADSSFGNLRGGWIQLRNGFGMQVSGHIVPHLLISSVIGGHSAKSLVKEARAFADSQTSITESYTPLSGATVAEVVSLGDNIDLVPWADVPDGNQKAVFGPDRAKDSPMRAVGNSAVRIRSAECQVLFSSSEEAEVVTEALDKENINRIEQLHDVVRCLTVLSGRPVAALGSWAQFSKTIANDISSVGYSYNGTLFDTAVHAASSQPIVLDREPVARLFHSFEKFKRSEKDVMRVSLDRLNQSLCRPSIVDKAIDLGIALEVLLLHGINSNSRGELKFRTSIRGATYLGGKKPERQKTLKLLKDAYDLRSNAVHSGVLKKEKESPPEKILDDATTIYSRIARKLIEQGSFPDWGAEYVIGGQ